jgi:hypothetical protein
MVPATWPRLWLLQRMPRNNKADRALRFARAAGGFLFDRSCGTVPPLQRFLGLESGEEIHA